MPCDLYQENRLGQCATNWILEFLEWSTQLSPLYKSLQQSLHLPDQGAIWRDCGADGLGLISRKYECIQGKICNKVIWRYACACMVIVPKKKEQCKNDIGMGKKSLYMETWDNNNNSDHHNLM